MLFGIKTLGLEEMFEYIKSRLPFQKNSKRIIQDIIFNFFKKQGMSGTIGDSSQNVIELFLQSIITLQN
jgi:hypothetical protein